MKRCPRCAADYYDEMLEFCLEDGAKLFVVSQTSDDVPTVTRPNRTKPFTEKTLDLPFSPAAKTLESVKPNDAPPVRQNDLPVENRVPVISQTLEIAPVIVALAHNWWQWLYASNQSSASISSFLISANFLIWLLLLAIGAGTGLLAVKRSQNKTFAVISLVILSVNLILFLVPKR